MYARCTFHHSPCAAEFYEISRTRSARRHNHVCHIFSLSVQLRSSDTPKIAISHWLAASPLQQCTHCRATLWLRHDRNDISLRSRWLAARVGWVTIDISPMHCTTSSSDNWLKSPASILVADGSKVAISMMQLSV